MDKIPGGGALQAALKAFSKQSTVPNIFVGGVHVGGHDDIKRKAENSELKALCDKNGISNNL